jgi:hypothetical protein
VYTHQPRVHNLGGHQLQPGGAALADVATVQESKVVAVPLVQAVVINESPCTHAAHTMQYRLMWDAVSPLLAWQAPNCSQTNRLSCPNPMMACMQLPPPHTHLRHTQWAAGGTPLRPVCDGCCVQTPDPRRHQSSRVPAAGWQARGASASWGPYVYGGGRSAWGVHTGRQQLLHGSCYCPKRIVAIAASAPTCRQLTSARTPPAGQPPPPHAPPPGAASARAHRSAQG